MKVKIKKIDENDVSVEAIRFGRKLKKWRAKHKLTQTEFAKLAGCCQASVSAVENLRVKDAHERAILLMKAAMENYKD